MKYIQIQIYLILKSCFQKSCNNLLFHHQSIWIFVIAVLEFNYVFYFDGYKSWFIMVLICVALIIYEVLHTPLIFICEFWHLDSLLWAFLIMHFVPFSNQFFTIFFFLFSQWSFLVFLIQTLYPKGGNYFLPIYYLSYF